MRSLTRVPFHKNPLITVVVASMQWSEAVPDPDSEVPKTLRDEFFDRMKTKQSERVRAIARIRSPLLP